MNKKTLKTLKSRNRKCFFEVTMQSYTIRVCKRRFILFSFFFFILIKVCENMTDANVVIGFYNAPAMARWELIVVNRKRIYIIFRNEGMKKNKKEGGGKEEKK